MSSKKEIIFSKLREAEEELAKVELMFKRMGMRIDFPHSMAAIKKMKEVASMKVCTGCGHTTIEERDRKCCPDENYIDWEKFMTKAWFDADFDLCDCDNPDVCEVQGVNFCRICKKEAETLRKPKE